MAEQRREESARPRRHRAAQEPEAEPGRRQEAVEEQPQTPTGGPGRDPEPDPEPAPQTGSGVESSGVGVPAPRPEGAAAPRGTAGPDLRKPPSPGRPGSDGTPGPPSRGSAGPYGAPHSPAPPPSWLAASRPDEPPARVRAATGWAAVAAGLTAALLLGEGLGVNLLLVALPAALGAYCAARAAGRRPSPWALLWAAGCLALLAVPALHDAAWPSTLAVMAALAAGSLALQGGRTWLSALLGPFGLLLAFPSAIGWAWRGARQRAQGARHRWGPVVRTALSATMLLVVFGALFAGADAAFADLLSGLAPEASVADGPLRVLFFLLGLATALAAARTAAAPRRWDRIVISAGTARGPIEWALPLLVLIMLFAAFNAVQLAVLFGGYDKVLEETGLTYAEYARQGFWQLLIATLLTLVVIALALRRAPRGRMRDATLVRVVLGTLCAMTLIVVLSALRRMDLYVDAYGLTRLRLTVAGVELWLGLVILLLMIAGALGAYGRGGATWLPRVVTASAVLGLLAFGLVSPDRLVAEQNVARYERTGTIDLLYLRHLSADAVPALDRLPEPLRSCALRDVARRMKTERNEPWYAASLGEARARALLADRPVDTACEPMGAYDGRGRLHG